MNRGPKTLHNYQLNYEGINMKLSIVIKAVIKAVKGKQFVATHYIKQDMQAMCLTAKTYNKITSKGELNVNSWTPAHKVTAKVFITLASSSSKATGIYFN